MARIRTFIAVDIGDEIRGRAVALQHRLSKIDPDTRWAAPDGLHVTLLFLGEVDERDVVGVCRAVAAVAAREPAFGLRVSGLGAFPTPRRPKTVWAGISDGATELVRLHAALEPPLLALGCYRKEDRAYTPHLTLGRVRADTGGQALAAELPKLLAWAGGRTTVNEVVVYASELGRAGPEYTPLGRAALGGS